MEPSPVPAMFRLNMMSAYAEAEFNYSDNSGA